MKTSKILTRTILVLSFISLLTDVASEMLYPVMPVFLKSIGFSVLLIGILEGMAEATAGLSKGYFGSLSDKRGKRIPFIKWGYGLSAFSKPMMAVFTFPWWIFLSRTMDRLGKGIRTSARDALLSAESTLENKGKVFGFHRSMDTLGAAIGPLVALIFLYFLPGHYKWLFIIAFIPGLAAISLTNLLHEKPKPLVNNGTNKVGFLSYLKYWGKATPEYRKLVFALLAFTFFNSSDVFLLLSIKAQGFSDVHMIAFYIFYNLIYALMSYPMGSLADRWGMKKVLATGFTLFAIVYCSFGFAHNYWHFIVLFLLYALYAASTEGISKAWISNISKKEEVATAIGFYTSFASILTLMASSLGGLIWYQFGAKAMFLFSGLGVVLVVMYIALPFIKEKIKLNGN
jgi:MFS family permease